MNPDDIAGVAAIVALVLLGLVSAARIMAGRCDR